MIMEKVYIVTSGDYSDYHIDAVFSTRKKAKEYVDAHGSDYCVEEYPVDDTPVEKKESIWLASIDWKTGEVMSANPENYDSYYTDKVDTVQYRDTGFNKYLDFVLESDSMERVKKVASERFMQVKALSKVKFPLLDKECVILKILSLPNHIYPFYNYHTGNIILYKSMDFVRGLVAPVEYRKETDNQ